MNLEPGFAVPKHSSEILLTDSTENMLPPTIRESYANTVLCQQVAAKEWKSYTKLNSTQLNRPSGQNGTEQKRYVYNGFTGFVVVSWMAVQIFLAA